MTIGNGAIQTPFGSFFKGQSMAQSNSDGLSFTAGVILNFTETVRDGEIDQVIIISWEDGRSSRCTPEDAKRFVLDHVVPEFAFPAPPQRVRSRILSTADGLINGDRARQWGGDKPSDDAGAMESFTRIGALFGSIIGEHHGNDPIAPHTITLLLAALKISRAISNPTAEDSYVDLAGYAALGGELARATPPTDQGAS